jgi:hypothetical protein
MAKPQTPEALQRVIDRIIALETTPEPGPWRRTLRFVADEARFGAAVDTLLENTLRAVLTSEIPPGHRLSMTWANPRSPWFWPGRTFRQQVLQQINEGGLVFAYVGHGLREPPEHPRSLDGWSARRASRMTGSRRPSRPQAPARSPKFCSFRTGGN